MRTRFGVHKESVGIHLITEKDLYRIHSSVLQALKFLNKNHHQFSTFRLPISLYLLTTIAMTPTSIIVTKSGQQTMQPYFRLLDLPTELVDVVYEYAIVSGDIGILRISRRVHSEAMKFLYQSACLHIHYEEPSSEKLRRNVTAPITAVPVTAGHISIANMQLVQNLDICVDFDVDFLGLLACLDEPLASFSGTNAPPRKICFLRIKNFEHMIHKPRVSQILQDISGLVNFQLLYVIASTRHVEEFIQLGRYVVQRMRNAEIYEMAKERLEATLGPSIWYNSNTEAGKYLEFHPLEYQKSPQGCLLWR